MQLATGCWRLLDSIYVFPMQFAFCVSQLEVLTSKCLVEFARMGRREEKQKRHDMPETDSHKEKKTGRWYNSVLLRWREKSAYRIFWDL